MTGKKHYCSNAKAAGRKRRPLFPFVCAGHNSYGKNQNGSVLFYIFIAIGLLGILTLAFVDSTREGATTQSAQQMTEKLYAQANAIRADILACVNTYPNSVDLNSDGDIDSDDNPNPPYPLDPTDLNNPAGAAPNDLVRYLQCPGAPSGSEYIYEGSGTTGQVYNDPPSGFLPWFYASRNAATKYVVIYTTFSSDDSVLSNAVKRLESRFNACEYETDDTSIPGTTFVRFYMFRDNC